MLQAFNPKLHQRVGNPHVAGSRKPSFAEMLLSFVFLLIMFPRFEPYRFRLPSVFFFSLFYHLQAYLLHFVACQDKKNLWHGVTIQPHLTPQTQSRKCQYRTPNAQNLFKTYSSMPWTNGVSNKRRCKIAEHALLTLAG